MCKAIHYFIWRVGKTGADVFPYEPFSHLLPKLRDNPEYDKGLKTYPRLPFAIVRMVCHLRSEHRDAFVVIPVLEMCHPILH